MKLVDTRRIEQIERDLPVERISAYQTNTTSSSWTKDMTYVKGTGWYGPFDLDRLKKDFMPKLAERARQGYRYPFLITSHLLFKDTVLTITPPPGKKARVKDMKYDRRERATPRKSLAIVKSETEYEPGTDLEEYLGGDR